MDKKYFIYLNAPGCALCIHGIYDCASDAMKAVDEGDGYYECRIGEWSNGMFPNYADTTYAGRTQLVLLAARGQ